MTRKLLHRLCATFLYIHKSSGFRLSPEISTLASPHVGTHTHTSFSAEPCARRQRKSRKIHSMRASPHMICATRCIKSAYVCMCDMCICPYQKYEIEIWIGHPTKLLSAKKCSRTATDIPKCILLALQKCYTIEMLHRNSSTTLPSSATNNMLCVKTTTTTQSCRTVVIHILWRRSPPLPAVNLGRRLVRRLASGRFLSLDSKEKVPSHTTSHKYMWM